MFRTGNGRLVRGGGGIVPDLVVPARPKPPFWWSAAADSGYDSAVADSVAVTLSADSSSRARWLGSSAEWEARLLPPLLERVAPAFPSLRGPTMPRLRPRATIGRPRRRGPMAARR